MAGRSDFLSVLPRTHKRLIALGQARGFIDNQQASDCRQLFKSAHKTYKNFRLNRKVPAEDLTPEVAPTIPA